MPERDAADRTELVVTQEVVERFREDLPKIREQMRQMRREASEIVEPLRHVREDTLRRRLR